VSTIRQTGNVAVPQNVGQKSGFHQSGPILNPVVPSGKTGAVIQKIDLSFCEIDLLAEKRVFQIGDRSRERRKNGSRPSKN
jgi:hypothetical protein